MIENKFNIILGDRNIGKTNLLFRISEILTNYGYKVVFISGDGVFYKNGPLCNQYFMNNNDIRLYKMINERDYQIILVDDIDLIVKNCLFEILKSKKTIISTSFTHIKEISSKIFFLDKKTICDDNDIIDKYEFLKQFQRDLKLNTLLNE